jgi:hypothetical protein
LTYSFEMFRRTLASERPARKPLIAGISAKLQGLVQSVSLGGCMTLGVVGTTAKFAPKLRELDLGELK